MANRLKSSYKNIHNPSFQEFRPLLTSFRITLNLGKLSQTLQHCTHEPSGNTVFRLRELAKQLWMWNSNIKMQRVWAFPAPWAQPSSPPPGKASLVPEVRHLDHNSKAPSPADAIAPHWPPGMCLLPDYIGRQLWERALQPVPTLLCVWHSRILAKHWEPNYLPQVCYEPGVTHVLWKVKKWKC